MFHPKYVEQLAGYKNTVQKCHLVGTFLKLIHDARNDELKKHRYMLAKNNIVPWIWNTKHLFQKEGQRAYEA
jgi:hypothetical protein